MQPECHGRNMSWQTTEHRIQEAWHHITSVMTQEMQNYPDPFIPVKEIKSSWHGILLHVKNETLKTTRVQLIVASPSWKRHLPEV